jgi:hypothetical protein
MGLDLSVKFEATTPSWPAVRDLLTRWAYPVQMRMIDGQLAFPDEEPSADWRELRLGTPGGMVTVRRETDRITLVIWGNADASLLTGRNALALAFAEAGGGTVMATEGELAAEQFRHKADLPAEIR